MSTAPVVGEPAPDLALRDQHGAGVSLTDLRGRAVLLVFYPHAFSRVCGGELQALRDAWPGMQRADRVLLAVSCDPVYALRAYAEQEGIGFGLLSDFWPHGEAATAYGCFDAERGSADRLSVLVDGEGVVRWTLRVERHEARPVDDYAAAFAGLDGTDAD